MSLTFDADRHEYFFDGKLVPSVTGILSPLTDFSFVPADVLKAAQQFGTAVHLACELDDLKELDEESLDPVLMPYVQGWRKFSQEHDVQWQVIEERLYHPLMRYAGTPDRIGMVDGLLTVVDIKTTAQLYPSVGPQLAAYAYAHDKTKAPSMIRMAVQLKGDGSYVAKKYTDLTDWPTFCSLLTLRNWCAKNHITPNFTKD